MKYNFEDIIDLLYKIGFDYYDEDVYYDYSVYIYKDYVVKIGQRYFTIRKNDQKIDIPTVWKWENVYQDLYKSEHFKFELRKYKIDNLLAS